MSMGFGCASRVIDAIVEAVGAPPHSFGSVEREFPYINYAVMRSRPFAFENTSASPIESTHDVHTVEWRLVRGCAPNSGLYEKAKGAAPMLWWDFDGVVVVEVDPEVVRAALQEHFAEQRRCDAALTNLRKTLRVALACQQMAAALSPNKECGK